MASDSMTRPNPDGCSRCGTMDCPFPAAKLAPKTSEEEWRTFWSARAQCLTRPTVDWQAEARAWKAEACGGEVTGEVARVRATRESTGRWWTWLPEDYPGAAVGDVLDVVLVKPEGT